jgi:hypothetical protein
VVISSALPARAQQQTQLQNPFASGFTGANPRDIKFTPIDVGKATRVFNLNNAVRAPAPPKTVGLGSFFPKFSLPTWPPRVGVNQLPQGKNPYQPNRPVGVNLFQPQK